jgi:hypothetical protein
MRELGIRTAAHGKYHLAAEAITEAHLRDPAFNTQPLGESGVCGRLNPDARVPHVLARQSMSKNALCRDCISKDEHNNAA